MDRQVSLFREEVIAQRFSRVDGEVVLIQPVGIQAVSLLLLGLVAAGTLWLALSSYARTETARGIMVTDIPSTKIIAVRAGQVIALGVHEGDLVTRGQRLATIQTEQSAEGGGSAIAESLVTVEARRNLATQQEQSARHRAESERERLSGILSGLRHQRVDLNAQLSLQQETEASARELFDRIQTLRNSGFISRVEIEQRRQALLAARQELARLHQQLSSLASEEAQTIAQLSRVSADAATEVATARITGETLAEQRAQLHGERAYEIVAPITGRVTSVQTAVGRTADPSLPLMEIVPQHTTLHAEIYAPTRAIGFVKPGLEVRLLYDAFPYERFGSFGGHLTAVSRAVMDPRQIAAPLNLQEAVYRLEVRPDGQGVEAYGHKEPLQPGMAVTANIILERRSFLSWLLEPLHAVLHRSS